MIYFSPCHAGCSEHTIIGEEKVREGPVLSLEGHQNAIIVHKEPGMEP